MIEKSKQVKIGPATTVCWTGSLWARFRWTSQSMDRIRSAAPADAGEIWAYHVAQDWREARPALGAGDGRQVVGVGDWLFSRGREEGSSLWCYRAQSIDSSDMLALPAGELPSLWIRALAGVVVEVERDLSLWQT